MYYINKIVGFAVSPLGIAIALGIAAVVFARLKRIRTAKWMWIFAVLWLWLWMTPLMTLLVGTPLENEFLSGGKVPSVESYPVADAIVLLGGSMGANDELSPYAEMSASADRVWQAARLWKSGKAPKIIATGDGSRESTLGLLIEFGVDGKRVEFMDARNTEEEAKGIKEKKILLVTSAWHAKRARMMFEKYAPGVEVVSAPADFEMNMMAGKTQWWKYFGIDPYTFHLNSVAFHEWIGIVGYAIFR